MTSRIRRALTWLTSTPCALAASATTGAATSSSTTMLVSTADVSTPSRLASSCACSWSSPSRGRWWSSAYSPAAASTPAWRIPPPSRLRHSRAVAMRSADATSTDPTGAPSPFDRQTDAVSASRPYVASSTPEATAAFQMRAPSRWIATPRSRDQSQSLLQLVDRLDQAAAAVVRVLDRDRGGGGEVPVGLRPHLRDQLVGVEPAAVGDHGAGGDPEDRGRGAHLVGDDVRVGVAEHLLAGLADQPHADLVAHRPGRHEQRRLVAEQPGDPLLERVDRRVLAVDVVPHLGLGHGPAHPGGRPGDRVRAQVDRQLDSPRSISATRNASSSDWPVFSRGSQAVSYRLLRSSSLISMAPPRHSVTSSPVSSTWMPPGQVPSARWTSKKPSTSSTTRSKCRVL